MVLLAVDAASTAFAIAVSAHTAWTHLTNYRKPHDQRLVVRILGLVPLYAVSAFAELLIPGSALAKLLVFSREVYEAFVIYAFYSLLTNTLGGERAIIYAKTGDPPITVFGFKTDIGDPHTFWVIKMMIMQYVYVRLLTVAVSALVGPSWTMLVVYNLSITVALNALMVFWAALREELRPYNVVLKFLSVKLVVFFSYWQVLALRFLSWLGLIKASELKVFENTLLCVECAIFAIVHQYAFPASDYEAAFGFGFARMRLPYAIRDVLGCKDVWHDFRSTFLCPKYGPRHFDSVEFVLDHPESNTRQRRIAAGLRYKDRGRAKYWLPLASNTTQTHSYGATQERPLAAPGGSGISNQDSESDLSDSEENLYLRARNSFGDPNYPVIVVREAEEYVTVAERMRMYEEANGEE